MQGNFEKEVQRKLDELHLQPSVPVWENIEREIRGERKRRRGVIWFFLAACLLTGGTWLALRETNTESKGSASLPQSPIKAEKEKTSSNSVIAPSGKQEQNDVPQAETRLSNGSNVPVKTQQPPVFTTAHTDVEQPIAATEPKHRTNKIRANDPRASAPLQKEEKRIVSPSAKVELTVPYPEVKESLRDEAKADVTTTNAIPSRDTITKTMDSAAAVPVALPLPKTVDSVLKKRVAFGGKWRPQAVVSAGWNLPTSAAFTNNRSIVANAVNSSGLGVTVPAPRVPSARRAGIGFALGVSFAKRAKKQWELQAGVQYRYASLLQKVGVKKALDTAIQYMQDKVAVEDVYTNTGQNDYTNRFHFVEVPVNIGYRFSTSLPLYASLGATYSRLLVTNALSYSAASNLYFANSNAYRKNAVSLSAAVQVGLLTGKKFSLRTGPFAQYDLSSLEVEVGSASPRLFFTGLRTAIIF